MKCKKLRGLRLGLVGVYLYFCSSIATAVEPVAPQNPPPQRAPVFVPKKQCTQDRIRYELSTIIKSVSQMGPKFCNRLGFVGNVVDEQNKCITVAAQIASKLINTVQPCCVQIKMMQYYKGPKGSFSHTLVGVFAPSYTGGGTPYKEDWLLSIDGWGTSCPPKITMGQAFGFDGEVYFSDPEVVIPLTPLYPTAQYCTDAVKITGPLCPNFIKTGQQLDRSRKGLIERTNALCSLNSQYKAVLQGDGNFVVYDMTETPWRVKWATGTLNPASYTVKVQNDCNVVAYRFNPANVPTWATNTDFPEPCTAYLIMQNDGNLVACRSDHRVLWSSEYGIRDSTNSSGYCPDGEDKVKIGVDFNNPKFGFNPPFLTPTPRGW